MLFPFSFLYLLPAFTYSQHCYLDKSASIHLMTYACLVTYSFPYVYTFSLYLLLHTAYFSLSPFICPSLHCLSDSSSNHLTMPC